MRFLRFLARELLIHGALFTVAGTAILSLLYLLSIGAPPIGVFLMLRRMSLMGDAMSHAILPGAAVGFLLGDGAPVTVMALNFPQPMDD